MNRGNYEVIGKAELERAGGCRQWALKLMWRGDGLPWWTASAGLEWPCSEAFFNSVKVGNRLTLSAEIEA
jgi:uncharacterized protein (DUF2126 family)